MRNSNSFQRDEDKLHDSQQQLPKQWDYLSKRLAQVEKGLTILEKKHSKLDKKLSNYTRQVGEFNSELTQEVLNIKSNLLSKAEVKQEISHNLQLLQNQITKSCNQIITNRFDNVSLSLIQRTETVQVKIKSISEQTKLYVDRAVFELKEILKKYVKQQSDLQKKIEKSSRQNSPSFIPRATVNKSTSSKKLIYDAASKEDNADKDSENGWLSKSRGNFTKDSVASANSNRVSYLREKLKQFEKINKKYETVPDKLEQKTQSEQIVKKMRNYREYLEQSESQLEPSNILNSQDIISYSSSKKNNYTLF